MWWWELNADIRVVTGGQSRVNSELSGNGRSPGGWCDLRHYTISPRYVYYSEAGGRAGPGRCAAGEVNPDEHGCRPVTEDRAWTCAHKQPQGFACCCQHALLWLSHLLQGVHSAVWYWASVQSHASCLSWRCSPKYMHRWWGSGTGVKAGWAVMIHHHRGPSWLLVQLEVY